jgi:acetyl-CoA synthetase
MSDRSALPTIRKSDAERDAAADSPAARAAFSWEAARARLAGLPGGGLNIAHEALGRHLPEHADQVAICWLGRDDSRREITYGALAADARASRMCWPRMESGGARGFIR